MEPLTYDVAVAGLGGMGSAALAHCALRGARAIGIEQFEAAHDLGASGGRTRIIRQAYYEDPAYVPMLLRAYDLWRDLQTRTGEELMRLTGLLLAGSEHSEVISGSARAAKAYDLPVEYLDAADMRTRYPQLRVADGEVGVFESRGGAVFPERAIRAHLRVAQDAGAHTLFGASVLQWHAQTDGIVLELSGHRRIRTQSVIVTLGPWFGDAMRQAGVALEIQRNVQVWYAPSVQAYGADTFPAFLLERESLPAPLYGFPDFGDGVKAAFHGYGAMTQPQGLDREIDAERDVRPVTQAVESWMPGAAGTYRAGKACMYSLTPDRHFVIDTDPRDRRIVLCGGFSGHGFKFAPVVGEIAAQLALDGETSHDIAFLALRRFAQ
ncbi:MAG TPA: N-methyl-L-tryptophan oxidase [Candidatus Baltobacteraceae bacterium]|nr:N-methyl-L-tryptophan oxidase [Candidatus Baltobacteraceae bacterium]